jgi:hypothetical protein
MNSNRALTAKKRVTRAYTVLAGLFVLIFVAMSLISLFLANVRL